MQTPVLLSTVILCLTAVGNHGSTFEATVTPTETSMDVLFDFILAQLCTVITSEGYDDYQIPDFYTEISLPLWLKLTVEGQGGTFKNASTLTRLGSAFTGSSNTDINMTVSAVSGIKVFDISFDYFKAKFLFFEIGRGPLKFKVASNKISFSMTIYTPEDLPCSTYMNWARIEDFSGQNLSLPWGILNALTEWLVNTVLDWSFIKSLTIKKLNPMFFSVAEYAIALTDFCSK